MLIYKVHTVCVKMNATNMLPRHLKTWHMHAAFLPLCVQHFDANPDHVQSCRMLQPKDNGAVLLLNYDVFSKKVQHV